MAIELIPKYNPEKDGFPPVGKALWIGIVSVAAIKGGERETMGAILSVLKSEEYFPRVENPKTPEELQYSKVVGQFTAMLENELNPNSLWPKGLNLPNTNKV
ncbi:hypothetical protein HY502_01705 [Candidatus Woesebacteria bacterium]|nr:hypothetical protein [Candidatus Woesebacteria bacterium]